MVYCNRCIISRCGKLQPTLWISSYVSKWNRQMFVCIWMDRTKCVLYWRKPVLADYCNQPCHYTPVVKNPACAADSPPTTTTTTTAPRITTTTSTATTTTPQATTTTTTTRSPADILAELCEQIKMAQSLLNQLKGIFPADPAITPDENLLKWSSKNSIKIILF